MAENAGSWPADPRAGSAEPVPETILPRTRLIRDASIPRGKQRFEVLHARVADVGSARSRPLS